MGRRRGLKGDFACGRSYGRCRLLLWVQSGRYFCVALRFGRPVHRPLRSGSFAMWSGYTFLLCRWFSTCWVLLGCVSGSGRCRLRQHRSLFVCAEFSVVVGCNDVDRSNPGNLQRPKRQLQLFDLSSGTFSSAATCGFGGGICSIVARAHRPATSTPEEPRCARQHLP